MTPLLLEHIKSAEMLDLMVFKSLLMLEMCTLACNITILMFSLLISIINCFLDSLLIVMLILGLLFFPSLFTIFCISMILSGDSLENTFLILRISLLLSLVA